MDSDFNDLIELQAIDKEISEVVSFLESIPAQISEIEHNLIDSDQIVIQAKERLTKNQKNRRDFDSQVQDLKERQKKFKQQLNAVRTNKEYSALLKEIEDVQMRIDGIEEQIIEDMLVADTLELEIKAAAEKAVGLRNVLNDSREQILQKKTKAEARKSELLKQKEARVPKIPADRMKVYLEIFRKKDGVALSPVMEEFCSMCYMRIRPQMLNEIKAESSIILCENCGRILYEPKKTG